jgi:hypothetical protein
MQIDDLFCMNERELVTMTPWRPGQTIEDRITAFHAKLYHLHDNDPKHMHKSVIDCSQKPGHGSHCELKDGSLMTLTTNCGSIVHRGLLRPLYPDELLLCMGIPCIQRFADAAGIRVWQLPVTKTSKITMAGNGMHVPSVGLVTLLAMVFVQPLPHL